jgi:3-hydroxyisobutyrate dehydrogenase-like beta-hydroxyacid dehydrogenase
MTVGLLHPGQMGSSIGAAAGADGKTVLWASEGRSAASRERAGKAGLEDAASIAALVERSSAILSVCPPAAAKDVAAEVAALSFGGTYVDANAVSPVTSREIGAIVEAAGAAYVDGGIIGGPAWNKGTTRLYLCGAGARAAAEIFAGSPLGVVVLDGAAGAASALKMAYAAWTKGSQGLLAGVLALAESQGVAEALQQEWALSQPQLARSAADRTRRVTAKAWRFVGEMLEIADTFESAGLPRHFHEGAAEVYRRMAGFKDAPEVPALEAVIRSLLG